MSSINITQEQRDAFDIEVKRLSRRRRLTGMFWASVALVCTYGLVIFFMIATIISGVLAKQ